VAAATLRFYGELADFLPRARRGAAFECDVGGRRSVKDLIESVGVPHGEVLVVLVDGASVAFDRVIEGGERIAVYPRFGDLDTTDLVTAGEAYPADAAFVLDGHLGRLAAYLRALGFDVAWNRDADDASIARTAQDERRVVLTRDVGLLKRSAVRHGRFVRATAPREQVAEIVRVFRLAPRAATFTRCLRCNVPFVAATRDEIRGLVPDRILGAFDEFRRCPKCGGAFWRGTHHARLSALLAEYL
jgi:YD repeat-containing protein